MSQITDPEKEINRIIAKHTSRTFENKLKLKEKYEVIDVSHDIIKELIDKSLYDFALMGYLNKVVYDLSYKLGSIRKTERKLKRIPRVPFECHYCGHILKKFMGDTEQLTKTKQKVPFKFWSGNKWTNIFMGECPFCGILFGAT